MYVQSCQDVRKSIYNTLCLFVRLRVEMSNGRIADQNADVEFG